MSAMKERCLSGGDGPKRVVSEISSSVGGVVCASDACELPRNEQQVSDLKRRQKKAGPGPSSVASCDELGVVMQKAYLEDSNQLFIREVKTLREPGIVVAVDRQLDDLVRFCTNVDEFGILTVDPTFNLGAFDVTVTTYRHLMLKCRRTKNYPAFIGPVLIHFKKSFSTYHFFSSTLVGLRPKLSCLKSFGTDGEIALYQAFKHSFPSATHLLCTIHARRNIKSKIQEMGISESVQQVILGDIFGKQVGTHHLEGLIDAENDEEYDDGLCSLIGKWKALDTGKDGPVCSFTEWFLRYKSKAVKEGLLRSNRQRAGLGDPPSQFTTNASESMNALIKMKMDYKKHELPVFLDKLKEVIDEQERELERAVLDRGKYQFSTEYQYLVKKQNDWFMKMSCGQREAHLKKVAKVDLHKKASGTSRKSHLSSLSSRQYIEDDSAASQSTAGLCHMPAHGHSMTECQLVDDGKVGNAPSLMSFHQEQTKRDKPTCSRRLFESQQQPLRDVHSPVQTSPSLASHQHAISSISQTQSVIHSSSSDGHLSVAICDFSESVITPIEVIKAIWRKAYELLQEPNSISSAPGQGDNARMVRSYSGTRPHLVTRKRSGQYVCDDKCPNWQSLAICAHSVAAAEHNHELLPFVRWFTKAKKVPNITKLATTEMPAGRGRKGSRAPPKKRPKMQPESRIPFSVQGEHSQTKATSSTSQSISNSSRVENICQGTATVTMSIGSADIVDTPGNLIMTTGQVNIHSPTEVTYHNMPSIPPPPPLIRCASTSPDASPFTLAFITGNIRVCRGCRQRYPKPALAPLNLCVRHQEWQEFAGPSGDPQTRYGNVYYHCNIPCIRARWPQFSSSMLHIPPTMLVQMLPVHTQYLAEQMPGRL